MKKSNLIPLVLVVSTFLILPIAFFFLNTKNGGNVQGAKTQANKKGIILKISSGNGTWDMMKYFCKTKDECLTSLFSGKIIDTTSGGIVEDSNVTVDYSSDWTNYEFIKVFVKPGWGSSTRTFKVTSAGVIPNVTIEKVTYGGINYNVILVPLNSVNGELLEAASFSDL